MLAELLMRLPPRVRSAVVPLVGALVTVLIWPTPAHAEDIEPAGMGDLMPGPNQAPPEGGETMYEEYGQAELWQLDYQLGKWEVIEKMGHGIASALNMGVTTIASATVKVVQWLFLLVEIPELSDAISGAISGASKGLMYSLLPTALVIGALVAWTQNRQGTGSALGQFGWLCVSAIVSVSLLSTPEVWVGGVDTTRQIGSNVALNVSNGGLGKGNEQFPFKLDHETQYTNDGKDDMLRKSSDAIWRGYVAGPWCVAEFGSLEVCQKHGQELLDQGTSKEDREDWLKKNVDEEAVGKESVEWRQGHQPWARVGIMGLALVSVTLFGALVLMLAFAGIASLISALMLLLSGVIFACLWVIPGRPRQWGLRWFDHLLAATLRSTIATIVLGAVLIVVTVATKLVGDYGWLPAMGLAAAAAVVGFQFNSVMGSIFGVTGGGGHGGALAGLLAARGASRLAGRVLRTPGRIGRQVGRLAGPTRMRPASGSGATRPRTPTRPPMPPHSSPPPTTGGPPARPDPGGGGGGGLPSRPHGPDSSGAAPPGDGAPSVTLTRMRRDVPPPRRSVPPGHLGGARRGLPPATPGTGGGAPPSPHRPTPPTGPRTPQLRPERGPQRHAFRTGPPPARQGQPRVIRATVIRSTPDPPPGRGSGGSTPPPPRRTRDRGERR